MKARVEDVRPVSCPVCRAQPGASCGEGGEHYRRYLIAAHRGLITFAQLPAVPDGYGAPAVRIVPEEAAP